MIPKVIILNKNKHTYLILQDPGHNKVYFNESREICLAELQIAGTRFSGLAGNYRWVSLAGIPYLAFDVEKELNEPDINLISRLSFAYALFILSGDENKPTLLPIAKSCFEYLDPKIGMLLKYKGKTNELFTRMMINVALLSSKFSYSDNIKLLDPLSGKGTTLFEAAIHGFDGYGIETDEKAVHEASLFFKKFLETEKYKHFAEKYKFAGKSKSAGLFKQEFEYSKDKDEFKDEKNRKRLVMVAGDTTQSSGYFKNNSFHLLVGDLPYGVTHGSKANPDQSQRSRNPIELLVGSLPGWHKLLKKEAIIVLAYNTFVTPKHKLEKILSDNGFQPFYEEPYNKFEHRVDQAIKRDIVVARKVG